MVRFDTFRLAFQYIHHTRKAIDELADLASELCVPNFVTFDDSLMTSPSVFIIAYFMGGVIALANSVPVEVVLIEES